MIRLQTNFIITILFFIFFFNKILNASSNFFIVTKIDNEIITNIDIAKEVNYLIALNNDLEKIDNKSLVNLARDSLIREKVKKNELKKNFKSFNVNEDVIKQLIENFYKRLKLNTIDEFRNYLNNYNVNLSAVESKIRIEILWNNLIYNKYANQININKKELEKKINKKRDNEIKKYLLSEILFSTEKTKDFEKLNNEIRKKILENGFKTAANIYSKSDTSKFGGRIGFIEESQLSKNILDKLNLLNIGEITDTIKVPKGYLILKLNEIKIEKVEKDFKKELDNLIRFETDRQLNQFSMIYYNKIKLNTKIINE